MSEQPATHEGEPSRASTIDSSHVIEVSAAIEEFRKGNRSSSSTTRAAKTRATSASPRTW